MDPFVVAGEVARIEGLTAGAAQAPPNRRKHGFPGDAEVRGLVPGDKACRNRRTRSSGTAHHGRQSTPRGRKGHPRSQFRP